jgi:hypothetical protein
MDRLSSCDPKPVDLFHDVVKEFDCAVLMGHRTQDEQNEAERTGHSKLRWPRSLHNKTPSQAVDVAPYPIDWNDRERFSLFAGYVLGLARARGVYIRWGGDWNRDTQVRDNSFDDLVHFELTMKGKT